MLVRASPTFYELASLCLSRFTGIAGIGFIKNEFGILYGNLILNKFFALLAGLNFDPAVEHALVLAELKLAILIIA